MACPDASDILPLGTPFAGLSNIDTQKFVRFSIRPLGEMSGSYVDSESRLEVPPPPKMSGKSPSLTSRTRDRLIAGKLVTRPILVMSSTFIFSSSSP